MTYVKLIALLALLPGLACAGDNALLMQDTTRIGGDTLSRGFGVAGVNEAAGRDNVQANANSVAMGGLGHTAIDQAAGGKVGRLFNGAALINGNAFSGFSGIININQASGNGNLQANVVSIGTTASPLSDAALGQVAPLTQKSTDLEMPLTGGTRRIGVGTAAFSGAHGVVQVSQTVGTANKIANSFSMNISAGMTPQ